YVPNEANYATGVLNGLLPNHLLGHALLDDARRYCGADELRHVVAIRRIVEEAAARRGEAPQDGLSQREATLRDVERPIEPRDPGDVATKIRIGHVSPEEVLQRRDGTAVARGQNHARHLLVRPAAAW